MSTVESVPIAAAAPKQKGARAAQRREAERLRRRIAERVKELECLHSLSSLLREQHTDLGDILQQVVDVLPSAWQYPDHACASITLKSRSFRSRGYREPRWRQRAPIGAEGERGGWLEIGYAEPLADGQKPDLLPEEQALLSTVAERLTEIIALKETQARLSTHEAHLRSLASELTLAEERERRRLALSLHDRIGQGLAVAKLKLETMKHLLPPEHHARVEDIAALIKQIVSDTRSLTFEISPPILYEIGFQQAVAWLGDHFTRHLGLPVEVRCDQELADLTEGVRVMLFRSIQELLTNTLKHARATRATVALECRGGELHVTVEDDGVGFDGGARSAYPSAAGGFGLFSIRERIGHLGGRVHIEAPSGKGTCVRLTVPCTEPGQARARGARR